MSQVDSQLIKTFAMSFSFHTTLFILDSVAGSVIYATGTVEFEDGLRT